MDKEKSKNEKKERKDDIDKSPIKDEHVNQYGKKHGDKTKENNN